MFATAAHFAVKSLFIFKSIKIKSVLNLLTASSFRAAESIAARLLACLLIMALLSTATILPWSKVQAEEAKKTLSLPSAGTGNSLANGGNLAVPEAFSFPAPSTSGNNSGTNGETFSLKSVATNLAAGIANPLSRMFDFSESGSSDAPDLTTEGAETVSAESPTSPAPAGINPASRKISALPENSAPAISAAETTTSTKAISPAASVNSAASAPRFATKLTTFDFNGDGRHDYAVFRPSTGWWYVLMSQPNGLPPVLEKKHWGTQGDKPVPADYDGDNKTDYAVYRPTSTGGTWCIVRSSNNVEGCQQFGANDDLPIPADYDGDGKADLAVFRSSTGAWYILYSATNTMYGVQWGANGDVPVPGEYEATPDGKTDIAVWRPSTGYFYVYTSGNSYIYYPWGLSTDVPVPGDYDGDGETDYGMWRPLTGYWYIIQSTNGAMLSANTGAQDDSTQDVPVPADYDGDGKDDIAVWRAVNGTTYFFKSTNGALTNQPHGSYGDMPAPSSYIKRTPSSPATAPTIAGLSSARLSPKNETGGTNLYSRNFSWGTGLVSLPGRAGLDLGLGLSYNSLVWTKVEGESKIVFDADKSNITPGFRFGFPVIEPMYADPVTGQNKHIMLTPSGARVELRQTSYSSSLNAAIYDAVDSSYTQMKVTGLNLPVDQQTPVLRTASGTVMKYAWSAGAFRCTEIVDRNGNYITVNHDSGGILRSVTDTLGRIVSINYDADLDPVSITQPWNGDPAHAWASFSYTTVQVNYNFGSLGVTGLTNNSSLKVLDRVTFADGGSYKFNYNIYGQVTRVSQYAADNPTNHRLNYINVNLTNYAGDAQTDCPRFSDTRTWAENFNNGNEVITTNTIQKNTSFTVPGTQTTENGTLITVTEASGTTEDVITESYVHSSGSKEGLSFATETCESAYSTNDACTATNRKRWTWTKWDLDTAGVNPRITETKVGDSGNTKRTEITYHSNYGLVNEVKEYDSNQTTPTVLRKTATDYNLSADYITTAENLSSNYITAARRIIGLPSEKRLYQGDSTLMSKVEFKYDDDDFSGTEQNIAPRQHYYSAQFSTGFRKGRGNLTSVKRWDVTDLSLTTGESKTVISKTAYNIAGAPVSSTDPANRITKISYADAFVNEQYVADPTINNTYAYPTKFTTPGAVAGTEVSSTIKYRYDYGAKMEAKSPAPVGSNQGRLTQNQYDSKGRLVRVTTNYGAYTRFDYPDAQNVVETYATLVDVNANNTVEAADEAKSETYFDGFGRTIKTRSPMSWNSSGVTLTWSGQKTEYDVLGRVKKQYVPTEIDSNWAATGDDAARGWLWTTHTYDWKDRVLSTTNTDGTITEAIYQGCGCAGGEVVEIKGEEVFETDWAGTRTTTLGRRTQKIYSDPLGRQFKTQIMEWNGSTPYSTVVNTLNARDQVTTIKEYAGADSAGVGLQETIMDYDGHGRLKTQHLPEQDANKSTVFEYYPDDSLKKKTDARGVVENYEYEHRGLLKQVTYNVPTDANSLYPNITWVEKPRDSNNYALNGLKITGSNYAADVIVVVSRLGNAGEPQLVELVRYTGGDLTRGTEFGLETLAVVDPGNVNYSFTDDKYVQIINAGSGKASEKLSLKSVGTGARINGTGDIHSIQQTPTTTFEYDDLGNRKAMIESGFGRVDYAYDELSRLKSENRQFSSVTNPSSADGKFKLSYDYTFSGGLKSITDPYNARIDYDYDKVGRATAVKGQAAYSGVTNYANELQYRAWGAVKHMKYGDNGATLDIGYNERLNPSQYDLLNSSGTRLMGAQYKYYDDGRLKFADDLRENRFDRKYIYDHVGRIAAALSGYAANGQPYDINNSTTGPYSHGYSYDKLGHLTGRNSSYWYSRNGGESYGAKYTNNRNENLGWEYDADGQEVKTVTTGTNSRTNLTKYKFDAAGRQVAGVLDGNGLQVKSTDSNRYYLRSSVLGGQVVSEALSENYSSSGTAGTKAATYVFLGNQVIAEQTLTNIGVTGGAQLIKWKQRDPHLTSVYDGGMQLALDPQGIATEVPDYSRLNQYPDYYSQQYNSYNYSGYGSYDPFQGIRSNSPYGYGSGGTGGVPGNPGSGCTIEGRPVSCDDAVRGFNNGSLRVDPRSNPANSINSPISFFQSWGPTERGTYFLAMSSGPVRLQTQQTNQEKKYTTDDAKCDNKLAAMFGGKGAMVSTGFDPATLTRGKYPKGTWRYEDHSAAPDGKGQGGIIHLYTNEYGSDVTVGVYAPKLTKDDPKIIPFDQYGTDVDSGKEAVINVGVRVEYSNGLHISFNHVGPSREKDVRPDGSFRIGDIAGIGGNRSWREIGGASPGSGYSHSHIHFSQAIIGTKGKNKGKVIGRQRVDPRKLFCKEFGF